MRLKMNKQKHFKKVIREVGYRHICTEIIIFFYYYLCFFFLSKKSERERAPEVFTLVYLNLFSSQFLIAALEYTRPTNTRALTIHSLCKNIQRIDPHHNRLNK